MMMRRILVVLALVALLGAAQGMHGTAAARDCRPSTPWAECS